MQLIPTTMKETTKEVKKIEGAKRSCERWCAQPRLKGRQTPQLLLEESIPRGGWMLVIKSQIIHAELSIVY